MTADPPGTALSLTHKFTDRRVADRAISLLAFTMLVTALAACIFKSPNLQLTMPKVPIHDPKPPQFHCG